MSQINIQKAQDVVDEFKKVAEEPEESVTLVATAIATKHFTRVVATKLVEEAFAQRKICI